MLEPQYDSANPQLFILEAFTNITNLHPALVCEIGKSISLPRFETEILDDLLDRTQALLKEQPILLYLDSPITVVGDLHGNFHDLTRLMYFNQYPPNSTFLFLGDYVDRGYYSLEICVLLFALMCAYPESIHLLRGNHEFESLNSQYGFKGEILGHHYPDGLYTRFNEVFNYLPLAAVIDNKIFCAHGGLSPKLHKLDEITQLGKPIDAYDSDILRDLVWSDPDPQTETFQASLRGCGHKFGVNQIKEFFDNNNIQMMIRAHQCVYKGIEKLPGVNFYTLFSCSNYCQNIGNNAGYILINKSEEIQAFSMDPIADIVPKRHASFITVPKMFIPQVLKHDLKLSKPVLTSREFESEEAITSVRSTSALKFQQFVNFHAPVLIDFNNEEILAGEYKIEEPEYKPPPQSLSLGKANSGRKEAQSTTFSSNHSPPSTPMNNNSPIPNLSNVGKFGFSLTNQKTQVTFARKRSRTMSFPKHRALSCQIPPEKLPGLSNVRLLDE